MYSIDTDRDAVFGELAGIMKSTRRVVDTALKLSGQFRQAPSVCAEIGEYPGLNNEVINDIVDNFWEVTQVDRVVDDHAGNVDRGMDDNKDGEEVHHETKETVQLWINLRRERLEKEPREALGACYRSQRLCRM